jgi:hypothetical protein
MSEYKGTFSVKNNTGGTITNVVVTHATTDWPTSTINPGKLSNGESAGGGTVTTSSGNKDRWSVSFINGSNQLRTGQENCGFESEDNGLNVTVVLNTEDFDIDMPKSSSCTDNDYQQS